MIPTAQGELSGDHYFDATTAQAFIAGATSTILSLHHPIALARAIAILDWFIGGRAQVTFGVGWLKVEYEAMGVPFGKRGRMADECLAAIIELWDADSPTISGEFVKFGDACFGPKPVHRPTVWVGGMPTLRCDARRASAMAGHRVLEQGPVTVLGSPEQIADQIKRKVIDAGVNGVIVDVVADGYTPGLITRVGEALRPVVGF